MRYHLWSPYPHGNGLSECGALPRFTGRTRHSLLSFDFGVPLQTVFDPFALPFSPARGSLCSGRGTTPVLPRVKRSITYILRTVKHLYREDQYDHRTAKSTADYLKCEKQPAKTNGSSQAVLVHSDRLNCSAASSCSSALARVVSVTLSPPWSRASSSLLPSRSSAVISV